MFSQAATNTTTTSGADSAAAGNAQASSSGESMDTVNVKLRIYKWAFSNSINLPDLSTGVIAYKQNESEGDAVLWYKTDQDKWVPVKVISGELSNVINYKGPSNAVFYTRKNTPGKNDYTYQEACSIPLPLNATELFLLMIQKGSSIKFYPMSTSPEDLPKDKVAVMNMTNQNIALSIGGHPKMLRSGSQTIFTPTQKMKNSLDLKIAQFNEKKQKWMPVYSNNISIPNPDNRCLILVYMPSANTKRFSVQMLNL